MKKRKLPIRSPTPPPPPPPPPPPNLYKLYCLAVTNFDTFSFQLVCKNKVGCRLWFTVYSVILWWSDLLMEETGVPRGNHRPVTSH